MPPGTVPGTGALAAPRRRVCQPRGKWCGRPCFTLGLGPDQWQAAQSHPSPRSRVSYEAPDTGSSLAGLLVGVWAGRPGTRVKVSIGGLAQRSQEHLIPFPKAGSAAEEQPRSCQVASGGSTGHPKDTPSPPRLTCVSPPTLVNKQNSIYPIFSSISTSVTSTPQLGLPKNWGSLPATASPFVPTSCQSTNLGLTPTLLAPDPSPDPQEVHFIWQLSIP